MLMRIILILILFCTVMSPLYAKEKSTVPAKSIQQQLSTKTITLSVPGMDCPVCPITIKKSLENIKGVTKVVVSFKSKTVTVSYDPKGITTKMLMKATADVGYQSTIVNKHTNGE